MSRDTVPEAKTASSNQLNYHVPALEKGLDILECLAVPGVPLTQAQLARALGRRAGEVFRMLSCLERRGFIQRDPVSGAYSLTLRLYELSHAHSPFRRLLRAAARPMRELTETLRESCHLSVLHRGKLLVLAQEESPARVRLSVEVGGTFPPLHTVSGRLLIAQLTGAALEDALELDGEYAALSAMEQAALVERLAVIRARGYEEAISEMIEGVRDLAVLVGTPISAVQAALAIASLPRNRKIRNDDILPAIRTCAEAIGRSAGIVV